MNRPTILFVSYALRGHANPCIALADEMVTRGYRVVFAIPEEGASWVNQNVIEVLTWEPSELHGVRLTGFQRRIRAKASKQRSWHCGQRLVTQSMADTYKHEFDAVHRLVQELTPDLVVTPQTAVPAMDVAVQAKIPLVIEAFYVPPSVRSKSSQLMVAEHGASLMQRFGSAFQASRHRAAWRKLDATRRSRSKCVAYADLFRRHEIVSATHECIEPDGVFRSNVHLTGPLVSAPRDLPHDLRGWLDRESNRGIIFVAFGTMVALQQQHVDVLAEALKQCGHRVLWALPKAQQRMLRELPTSMRVEEFVDQHAVLSHPAVSCFVSHAGGNSFMESMLCGKPMLACPFMLDQPFFARRVGELNVGICIAGHHMKTPTVHESLAKLLTDSSFTRNAGQLASILRSAPGISGAGDVLEKVLQESLVRGRAA